MTEGLLCIRSYTCSFFFKVFPGKLSLFAIMYMYLLKVAFARQGISDSVINYIFGTFCSQMTLEIVKQEINSIDVSYNNHFKIGVVFLWTSSYPLRASYLSLLFKYQ